MLQTILCDRRIGADIGQHGRHIRGDHARTFGNAIYRNRLSVKRDHGGRAFGKCIGRTNSFCCILPAITAQISDNPILHIQDKICLQHFTYYAGRGYEQTLRRDIQRAGKHVSIGGDSLIAAHTSKGICIASIGDNCTGTATLDAGTR